MQQCQRNTTVTVKQSARVNVDGFVNQFSSNTSHIVTQIPDSQQGSSMSLTAIQFYMGGHQTHQRALAPPVV
jgi:hypothetical protein